MTVVSKDTCSDNFGEGCHGLVPQNIAGRPESDIDEFTVSPGHPYRKPFIGIFGTDSLHRSLTFPELKHFALIKIDTTSDVTIIGIAGEWNPSDRNETDFKDGDIPLKKIVIKNGCQQKL
jgi:hypothetical protein